MEFNSIHHPINNNISNQNKLHGTPFFQPKLTVNQPNDIYEQEADAVADRIANSEGSSTKETFFAPSSSAVNIQRKCAKCEEEDKNIQRKSISDNITQVIQAKSQDSSHVNDALSQQISSSKGSGSSMDGTTLDFMSSSFGTDLSGVKIHTDSNAIQLSRDLNARAFTIGNDVYFNQGEYNPNTQSGKHLLAHELTHTLQQRNTIQRNTIQRCADVASLADYNTRMSAITARTEYTSLPATDRALTRRIINSGRGWNNCQYIATNLELLFNTVTLPPSAISGASAPRVLEAVNNENARLATPVGAMMAQNEEALTSDPARNWTTLVGSGGKTFRIDRTDPNNIIVKIKIHLIGNATEIPNIIALEDGIEKHASVRGYTVDIEFVNAAGRDVFEVEANSGGWTTAGNWSATSPETLAHETHHLLGLPDRYNYIESHAGNDSMLISTRLYWFNHQVNLGEAWRPTPNSIMHTNANQPLDTDICEVAQLGAPCVTARQNRQNYFDALTSARMKALSAYWKLIGLAPRSPADRFTPSDQQMRIDYALRLSRTIFGEEVPIDRLSAVTSQVRDRLTPGMVMTDALPTDINCSVSNIAYVTGNSPPFTICPTFYSSSRELQTNSLIKQAVHLVGVSPGSENFQCTSSLCLSNCNDVNTANAWVKFITCMADYR